MTCLKRWISLASNGTSTIFFNTVQLCRDGILIIKRHSRSTYERRDCNRATLALINSCNNKKVQPQGSPAGSETFIVSVLILEPQPSLHRLSSLTLARRITQANGEIKRTQCCSREKWNSYRLIRTYRIPNSFKPSFNSSNNSLSDRISYA